MYEYLDVQMAFFLTNEHWMDAVEHATHRLSPVSQAGRTRTRESERALVSPSDHLDLTTT